MFFSCVSGKLTTDDGMTFDYNRLGSQKLEDVYFYKELPDGTIIQGGIGSQESQTEILKTVNKILNIMQKLYPGLL